MFDDQEFIDAIIESSQLAYENHLRRLFVTLLLMNTCPSMMKSEKVFGN